MEFDDIRLLPAPMSYVESRNDTDTSQKLVGELLSLPLIASNMSSVYSTELSKECSAFGTQSITHRFTDITTNVELFKKGSHPWVSVGVSDRELERAQALVVAGATVICLEVANAAHISCVRQYNRLASLFPGIQLIVGTFATKEQVFAFLDLVKRKPDAILIGLGNGSRCWTYKRITGVGLPSVETILSTVQTGIPVILSGGVAKPSDFVKALALGASAVLSGSQFAACVESGAKGFVQENGQYLKADPLGRQAQFKYYFGSASKDAYEEQSKEASWRTPEGEGKMLPITGTVQKMLLEYQASLRSAMTYLNASTLEEFRKNVKWEKM